MTARYDRELLFAGRSTANMFFGSVNAQEYAGVGGVGAWSVNHFTVNRAVSEADTLAKLRAVVETLVVDLYKDPSDPQL